MLVNENGDVQLWRIPTHVIEEHVLPKLGNGCCYMFACTCLSARTIVLRTRAAIKHKQLRTCDDHVVAILCVERGRVHVLNYLRPNLPLRIIDIASRNGHLDVLKLMHQQTNYDTRSRQFVFVS